MRAKKGSVTVKSYRGMLQIYIPNGLSNQKYLYLGIPDTPENRSAAEQKARVISSDIAFDAFDSTLEKYKLKINSKNPSLSELWERYVLFKLDHVALTTVQKDFKRVRNHISKLPSQDPDQARRIKKYLIANFTPKTAVKILNQLSACCQWAIEEGLIKRNLFPDLTKIKVKSAKLVNPFTQEEKSLIIKGFCNNPKWQHYTGFVIFLFLTGCRTSEAIGLRWGHVDANLEFILFQEALVGKIRKSTKTGKARRFPINDQLRALLCDIRPSTYCSEDLVFKSPTGVAIDSHNFLNRAWKGILSELNIPYRVQYNTRHTFISSCLEAGISITQVAAWVGNSPDTIWKFYAGVVSTKDVPPL